MVTGPYSLNAHAGRRHVYAYILRRMRAAARDDDDPPHVLQTAPRHERGRRLGAECNNMLLVASFAHTKLEASVIQTSAKAFTWARLGLSSHTDSVPTPFLSPSALVLSASRPPALRCCPLVVPRKGTLAVGDGRAALLGSSNRSSMRSGRGLLGGSLGSPSRM